MVLDGVFSVKDLTQKDIKKGVSLKLIVIPKMLKMNLQLLFRRMDLLLFGKVLGRMDPCSVFLDKDIIIKE